MLMTAQCTSWIKFQATEPDGAIQAGPGNLPKWRGWSSEFEEVTVAQVHWEVHQRGERGTENHRAQQRVPPESSGKY